MQANTEQDPRYQLLQAECFRRDANRTGRIHVSEWKEALWTVDWQLTSEKVDEMVRLADQEEDDILYETSIPRLRWT